MKLFKKITRGNLMQIQEKTLAFLTEKRQDILTRKGNFTFWTMKNRDLLDWVPEIEEGAATYGLKCEFIAAYVMHSLNDSGLHSDNHKHEARINFPILNCERTYLEYYSGGISRPHFSPHSSSTETTTMITPDSTTKFLGAIEVNQVTCKCATFRKDV